MIKLSDIIADAIEEADAKMREAKGTDPFTDDQLPNEDPDLEQGAKACNNCRWYITDLSKCALLTPPEVVSQGICDFWAQGEPSTSDQLSPRQKISKRDANYMDDYHKHHLNLANPSG